MRHALILILCLATVPVAAQDTSTAEDTGTAEDIEQGVDLLSEGARRLLRGLMGEVEPQMQEMAEALKEWNFNGIGIDDLGQYHPPEKLPNGDIIIRRKTPLDVPMDDEIEI